MRDEARFAERLAELSRSFAGRLRERYDELEEALTAVERHGKGEDLEELRRLAHNLGGVSGSYGFQEVGELALRLEAEVAGEGPQSQPDLRSCWRIMGALRRAVQEAELRSVPTSLDLTPLGESAPGRRPVLLVEDDDDFASLLAQQLSPYGYDVAHHRTPEAVVEAVEKEEPAALIIDVNLADGVRGSEIPAKLPATAREALPILFISRDEGFAARLEAVRAGAAAYLTKPVDVEHLANVLDRLLRDSPDAWLRALIVDDDEDDGQLYAAALEKAGMVAQVTTDPSEALDLIQEFGPEIILLDLYMPEMRGDELASVIRQHVAYLSIPIVFVSAEADPRLQLNALRSGADDFLRKPVDPEQLVSSVHIRAQRYRQWQATMQRDSLTGLLNHRNIKEALEGECRRALHTGSPLSVAMVDIDRFKSVNDTYGHPVGDRVIRSLARVLVQRLRRADIVGRYGGEEFLLILPDTPVADATRVLDELRVSFAGLSHRAGDRTFSCSMSGGVVELEPDESAGSVLERADQALYAAKRAGRNRVADGGAA